MYGDTIFPSEFRTGIQKIGGTGFTVTPALWSSILDNEVPVNCVYVKFTNSSDVKRLKLFYIHAIHKQHVTV